MVKKDFSKAKKYRCKTKSLLKQVRKLKKLRSKRRRRNPLVEKKTDAWEII